MLEGQLLALKDTLADRVNEPLPVEDFVVTPEALPPRLAPTPPPPPFVMEGLGVEEAVRLPVSVAFVATEEAEA